MNHYRLSAQGNKRKLERNKDGFVKKWTIANSQDREERKRGRELDKKAKDETVLSFKEREPLQTVYTKKEDKFGKKTLKIGLSPTSKYEPLQTIYLYGEERKRERELEKKSKVYCPVSKNVNHCRQPAQCRK